MARPARPDLEVGSRQGYVDGCVSPLRRAAVRAAGRERVSHTARLKAELDLSAAVSCLALGNE